MHYINQNFRFYRTYNRFTQQEIADKLKTTLGRVKMYEKDHATPPVEMIIKIADMMQVSIDTLIKVKLNTGNYLKLKGESAPDLRSRIEALEKTVNKIVNKITEKTQKSISNKK